MPIASGFGRDPNPNYVSVRRTNLSLFICFVLSFLCIVS